MTQSKSGGAATQGRHEITFAEFLHSFRRGELLAESDRQLAELMEAIHQSGGSGTLTLKLPFKVNKAGQIECDPQVTVAKPKRQLGTGIYYLTDDARLTRRDPNQLDMLDDLAARRTNAAE